MANVELKVNGKANGDIHAVLDSIVIELKAKAIKDAAKKAGKLVERRAKQLVPVGDTRHKPEKKSLKSAIKTKVVQYANDAIAVAVVGPTNRDGAHGHLVESGHMIVPRGKKGESNRGGQATGARVEGKPFLAPAVDQTQSHQEQVIIETLREYAEKEGTIRV